MSSKPPVIPSGLYRIKNVRSNTYMTGSAEQVNAVHGWHSRTNDQNQQWELRTRDGPIDSYGRPSRYTYYISNAGDGRYLAISGVTDGAKVRKASENPTEWVISEAERSGQYVISVQGSSLFLELKDGRNENKAAIILNKSSEGTDSSDYYDRRSRHSSPKYEAQQKWIFKRLDRKSADRSVAKNSSSRRQVDARPEARTRAGRPSATESNGPTTPHWRSLLSITQGGADARIIPPATYSIRNILGGNAPLNPNPYGAPEWEVQTGLNGYWFKGQMFGTFLSYDEKSPKEGDAVTSGAKPSEWIVKRAHEGYYIRPFAHQNLLIGFGEVVGGSVSLCLSSENSRSRQTWRFEMANA